MPLSSQPQTEILKGLSGILPSLFPIAKVSDIRQEILVGRIPVDLKAKIKIGPTTKTYIMKVQSSGEPRHVYAALGQLLLAAKKMPKAYPVLIVPSMSAEGKELCKQANVGYASFNGDLFLKYAAVSIEHSFGKNNSSMIADFLHKKRAESKIQSLTPFIEQALRSQRQRKQPFPFSAKASRILRIFLENPKRSWTIAQAAQEAQINPRMALLVINYLTDKLLVNKERGAIVLTKPKELLNLWVGQYGFKKDNEILAFHSMDRTSEEFLQRLRKLPQESQGKYALTLYAGSTLVAPYIRFSENHLYIEGDLQSWVDRLGLKSVEAGANTFLVWPYDSSVFYKARKIQNISVVSDLQLYLDLYNFNDRAREQADVLYKKVVDFPATESPTGPPRSSGGK